MQIHQQFKQQLHQSPLSIHNHYLHTKSLSNSNFKCNHIVRELKHRSDTTSKLKNSNIKCVNFMRHRRNDERIEGIPRNLQQKRKFLYCTTQTNKQYLICSFWFKHENISFLCSLIYFILSSHFYQVIPKF